MPLAAVSAHSFYSTPFDLFELFGDEVLVVVRAEDMADVELDVILLLLLLNFVKNIVDSKDLPLNILRETLQQNKILQGHPQ